MFSRAHNISRRPPDLQHRADLKFADIPNGVQALYKMPAEARRLCREVAALSVPDGADVLFNNKIVIVHNTSLIVFWFYVYRNTECHYSCDYYRN